MRHTWIPRSNWHALVICRLLRWECLGQWDIPRSNWHSSVICILIFSDGNAFANETYLTYLQMVCQWKIYWLTCHTSVHLTYLGHKYDYFCTATNTSTRKLIHSIDHAQAETGSEAVKYPAVMTLVNSHFSEKLGSILNQAAETDSAADVQNILTHRQLFSFVCWFTLL